MGLVPGLPAGPVSSVPKSGVTSASWTIWALGLAVASAWVSTKLTLALSTVALMMLCRKGVKAEPSGVFVGMYSLEMESPLLSVTVVGSDENVPPGVEETTCQLTVLPAMGLPLASVTLTTLG